MRHVQQTRNRDNETECDEEWTRKGLDIARCRHMLRYICRVLCTVNSMHGIFTVACSPSCIRSVHVHSMHVSSVQKGFHLESDASHPKSAGLGRAGTGQSPVTTHTLFGKPRVAHVAPMPIWLVGCSPLSDNLVRTTLSYSTE